MDSAWRRIKGKLGGHPEPGDLIGLAKSATNDDDLIALSNEVLASTSALRRAVAVQQVILGALILWVDDKPEWIAWESALLEALGATVVNATSTKAAVECLTSQSFDLILSDIARHGDSTAGIEAIPELRQAGQDIPIVFYIADLNPELGVPPGAFGITNRPDELIHLVLDILERRKF